MKYIIAPPVLVVICIWLTFFNGLAYIFSWLWDLKIPDFDFLPWKSYHLKRHHINISPFAKTPNSSSTEHIYKSYYHYLFGVGPVKLEERS